MPAPRRAAADSDEAGAMERRIKAAFLYKFAGYVQWPPESFPRPTTPIRIGVAGDRQMASELSQLVVGHTSGGRRIIVVQPDPTQVKDLHILFVGRSEQKRLRQWCDAAQNTPTLLVTDSDGALEQGSMINFVLIDGHVRFEISTAPAEKRGLTLSSGLLTVAKSVVPARP
jgi:hypothetical protein